MEAITSLKDPILTAALQRCANEAIHTPGTIQPHGCLLALDAKLRICQASKNAVDYLGVPEERILGAQASELLPAAAAEQLSDIYAAGDPGKIVTLSQLTWQNDQRTGFTVQAHFNADLLIVEIERIPNNTGLDALEQEFMSVRNRLWNIDNCTDLERYLAEVADELKRLTNVDRVKIYRFDANWDGEVIAEKRSKDVESFLGHHFPAADIPPQARELYIKNRIRLITDVDAAAIPLTPRFNPDTGLPLDLSFASLRSFSPVHLEYLRNMGVRASLTISLICNGRLWGLVACHHYRPLSLSPQIRELAEFLGRSASQKIAELEQAELSRIREQAQQALDHLATGIGSNSQPDMDSLFSTKGQGLLDVVGARGAVICVNQRKYHIGLTPDVAFLQGLADWLMQFPDGSTYYTDSLPGHYPPAASCNGIANGLLIAPIDHLMANYVMWFRPEILQTIKWAGNPEKIVSRADDGYCISPRKSFAAWVQSYGGHSSKWSHADIEIATSMSESLIRRIVEKRIECAGSWQAHDLIPDNRTLFMEIDRNLRYRSISGNCHQLLGFQEKELVRHGLSDFVFAEDADAVARYMVRMLADDPERHPVTFRHSCKDGHYIWIEASLAPRKERDTETYPLIFRDASERQEYNQVMENLYLRHSKHSAERSEALLVLDANRKILHANPTALKLLGYTIDDLANVDFCSTLCLHQLCSACKGQSNLCTDARASQQSIVIREMDGRLNHRDGGTIPISLWWLRFQDPKPGNPASALIFRMQDRASGNVATPCENRIGIVVTDRVGNIRSVNDIFTQMTGYTAAEAIGRTPAMLRSGMHSKEYYKLFWKSLAEQGHWEGEIWNKRKTGEIYPQRSHVLAVFDSAGVVINYIALTQDASTKIKIDEKLHQLPDFDGLTGLPNRIHFEKAVAKAIAEHPDAPFTIGFFDLDNFTSINDALGHIAGDRLLYQLASRMRIELRDRDQLARWGGDKFALFLCGTETGEQVHAAIQRMHNALTRPISISGTQVTPVARAGISRYPTDARDVDALLQAADTAQGRAKHQGIGSICHYSSELGKAVQQNFELANELRIALKEHQFFMMYQPQVDATGSRLVGLEALIRWRHPTRGIVSPALFISLAEEANLMVELGTEVLHLVCRQIAHWRREFPFDVPVGINVSPQQLKPGFPEKLAQALQDNQLPAHLIEIEITESALKPTPEIRALVNEIKSLGVNLAIDDFGTGYSSLSHLKLFPFDRLKIDKTFVDGLPDNADDIAIGQAIIALGQALKVNVIAEGVESDAQAEFLRVQGVHAIQGYLYSKPIQEELVPDYFLKSCRDTSS